jgi:hypothetical protein
MRLAILLLFISSNAFAQPKKLQEIEILNADKMNKPFLTRIIKTKVGNLLDSLTLEQDIFFLTRLNGVLKVEYKIEDLDTIFCRLILDVTETFTTIPIVNIGTTDRTGFYRLGIQESNLNGKNNSLGGFYQYNEFHSFGLNYSAPYLFSNKFGVETNIQSLSSKEPILIANKISNYKYTNTSFEILGRYQANFKNALKFGISLFNEKYTYLDGATDPSVPQLLDVMKKLYKLNYLFNNLRYDYFLLNGFTNSLNLQYVTSKNRFQNKFIIGWNDCNFYKIVGKKGNFATRLRVGISTNNNSPFAPFVVDNNLNIRGVGNLIDRGTGTLVLNTEYRQIVYTKNKFVLQTNVFVDAGSFRNPGGSLNDFTNKKNLSLYPGLGLRFIHKTIFNAVFRLDYGYGIINNEKKNNGFVFGIGQYF